MNVKLWDKIVKKNLKYHSEMADWIAYAYSAAVAAGGLIGYVKKGSLASGIMGLSFGALAGFGAYQSSKDPSNYYLSLGVSVLLTGVMGQRFFSSGKVMPAGLVAALSLAMVARYGARYYQGLNSPTKTN